MVIPGCAHSHEILEKTHLLLVSKACQPKLGMTKRVSDGSITLDDYDAQSLEVARHVGTGLFMIRIGNLIYIDNVCNLLLNDLVIDLDDEPGIDSTAQDSDQSNFPDCFIHAMGNVYVDMECTMTGTPVTPDPKCLVSGPCWNLFLRCQLLESQSPCCCRDVPCEQQWTHSVFWSVEELECFMHTLQ